MLFDFLIDGLLNFLIPKSTIGFLVRLAVVVGVVVVISELTERGVI